MFRAHILVRNDASVWKGSKHEMVAIEVVNLNKIGNTGACTRGGKVLFFDSFGLHKSIAKKPY